MRPSRGAGRPSCLAVNPGNREASAARRRRLLAAFRTLDEDAQADLLEAVESMTIIAGPSSSPHLSDAREVIRRIYTAAGW